VPHAGAIQELTLRSDVLGEERTLLVRLPQGYDSGAARYPVLFVLDAEWHFNLATADAELLSECSYVHPRPVPQLIVVGIVNRDRNRDFTPTHCPELSGMRFPTSGGADEFRRFLTDEVVPVIDRTYRTHPYRILAGWSLGGLFTVDTLLAGTPVFSAFLAISPSLWWDDRLTARSLAEDQDRTGPSQPARLIVTLGSSEEGSMVEGATRELMADLEANPLPNLAPELVPIEGLGHNYSPKMAYFLGLATIFADWNLPPETVAKGLATIDAYYESLSRSFHFTVPPPEDSYSTLGWKLFEEGRRDEALEVFMTWTDRHPQSSVAVASLGSLFRELGRSEKAVAMLRKALELERASATPRNVFILDLERDIAELLTTTEPNES
jgi:predicted alpha/beta superfamily hydrolase